MKRLTILFLALALLLGLAGCSFGNPVRVKGIVSSIDTRLEATGKTVTVTVSGLKFIDSEYCAGNPHVGEYQSVRVSPDEDYSLGDVVQLSCNCVDRLSYPVCKVYQP